MRRRIRHHARKAKHIIYQETLIDHTEHFWTFIGSFFGIGIIGFISSRYLEVYDNMFLIASFGVSSVLIYGLINSPLAQPRNLIGGHVIGAFIGVTMHKLIPTEIWLASALSVSLTIVAMQITKTLHPPAGATSLMANIGSAKVQALGYLFVLSPVLSGVLVLLLVAIICNNATSHRSYPKNKNWFKIWERKYHRNTTKKAGQNNSEPA
jgi:CBS domain-containing membrane protein